MQQPLVDVKYPVLLSWDERKRFKQEWEQYVPYGLLLPHEEQAMVNHSQTLERLKERGGLSYHEMLCVIEDKKWPKEWYGSGLPPVDEMRARVLIHVHDYLSKRSDLNPYWSKVKDILWEQMTMLGVDTW